MRTSKHQAGFTLIEVCVVFIVLALGGLVGYLAIQQLNKKPQLTEIHSVQQPAVPSASEPSVAPAPTIDVATDLDQASSAIDKTDINSDSDTAQLDRELANF